MALVFTLPQVRALGEIVLSLLRSCKHFGVVEKTRLGFLTVAESLLASHSPPLAGLVTEWLNRLLAAVRSQVGCV